MPSFTPRYSISARPPLCRISLNMGYSEGSAPAGAMKYSMWMISPKGRFASNMPKAMGSSSNGSNWRTIARYSSTQAITIITR